MTKLNLIVNTAARRCDANEYSPVVRDIAEATPIAAQAIAAWPEYFRTPLVRLDEFAEDVGVGSVHYKDEAERFGLGSFKALGGAYAVYCLLRDVIAREHGAVYPDLLSDMLARVHEPITEEITVTSATAGNHGRSVAWGAQVFGCRAVIYVHSGVSGERISAIERYGAEVRQVDGDYDESVRIAATTAANEGWFVVSDTSYPGYTEIPCRVMQGYTVLFDEITEVLTEAPTHIFLQGGVGGFAASAAAYFAFGCGTTRPAIVIVEPDRADCLYQSAKAGSLRHSGGDLDTIMLGMACGEPSVIAWDVLREVGDGFMTISDAAAIDAMRYLNQLSVDGRKIIAGECAGAGLAGLNILAANSEVARELKLGAESRVLLVGTEGATDTKAYWRLVNSVA